jgi:hypothetical protein
VLFATKEAEAESVNSAKEARPAVRERIGAIIDERSQRWPRNCEEKHSDGNVLYYIACHF